MRNPNSTLAKTGTTARKGFRRFGGCRSAGHIRDGERRWGAPVSVGMLRVSLLLLPLVCSAAGELDYPDAFGHRANPPRSGYLRSALGGSSRIARHQEGRHPIAWAPSAGYKGKVLSSNSGREFLAFSGIRYALPPVGHLRFQVPLGLHDTEELLDATEEGPSCLQLDPFDKSETVLGDEDCLFLNVYTPSLENSSYPVIFWVHGGSWKFGSGGAKMYGPGALLDRDVVLVTVNYRLGPIGFSSLEDEVHPGNLGLKDLVSALYWVSRNIGSFGGDPGRITAAGQSAGAAAVCFLMNAPAAHGLLVGGIAQSGSWLSPWAVGVPGKVREKTLKLADIAGCKGKTSHAIIDCLLELPGKRLIEATKGFGMLEQELLPFRPVVEPGGGVVIEDPWSSIPAPLPLLTGFTSSEGAFIAVIISQGGGFLVTLLDRAFGRFAPDMLMYSDTASSPQEVTTALRNFYLGEANITTENLEPVIEMVSDAWIVFPVHETATRHSGPVYGYMFDHKGATDIVHVLGSTHDYGVSHGDDIPYLFNTEKLDLRKIGNDADRRTSQDLTEIWANFATTGRPQLEGLEWSELHDGGYMKISNGYSQGPVLTERVSFWESLPVRDRVKFGLEGLEWSELHDGGYMKISNGYSQGPVLTERVSFWESLPVRDRVKFGVSPQARTESSSSEDLLGLGFF